MAQERLAEIRVRLEQFINQLIDNSSLDLKAEVRVREDEAVEVMFQGFDLPLLLGHNAELLDALQYLARRVLADDVAEGVQIDFDANGYRGARRHELELMAQKAAERVRVSRVAFVFDPMNAQDRRIIHMALVEHQGVRTESEGDGQMRRVKIVPA